MKHNFTPKYLGLTLIRTLTFNEHLDRTGKKMRSRVNLVQQLAGLALIRTLTFNEHLDRTGKKMRSRVNLVQQLAGAVWDSNAKTLRMAVLALTYSAAKYGAKVWCNSAHSTCKES